MPTYTRRTDKQVLTHITHPNPRATWTPGTSLPPSRHCPNLHPACPRTAPQAPWGPPRLPAFQVVQEVRSPQWDQGIPTEGGRGWVRDPSGARHLRGDTRLRACAQWWGRGCWSLTGCPGSPSSPRSPLAPSWPCRDEAGSEGGPSSGWHHPKTAHPPILPPGLPHPPVPMPRPLSHSEALCCRPPLAPSPPRVILTRGPASPGGPGSPGKPTGP